MSQDSTPEKNISKVGFCKCDVLFGNMEGRDLKLDWEHPMEVLLLFRLQPTVISIIIYVNTSEM